MNDTQAIMEMLAYRRPAGSKTERKFIQTYLEPLGVERDDMGNAFKRIGTAPVLWSAHTDTVHRTGGLQNVRLLDGIASVADKVSNCLGADNTAGVWLLAEMIRADIPGLYVFHRAEEIGGKGSAHFVRNNAPRLAGIKAAIAFDRKGTGSVITHQWQGRTASEEFAVSLGVGLGLGHTPDDGGTFTDTANYTDDIGECSNVSAGFRGEHTKGETLDVPYLIDLRDAVLRLDLDAIVYKRQPGEVEKLPPLDFKKMGWSKREFGLEQLGWGWDAEVAHHASGLTIADVLQDYPDEMADYLEQQGFDVDTLIRAAYQRGAVIRR